LPSISLCAASPNWSRGPIADWLPAQVSRTAAALPEVEARESHGAPAWSIKGGKFFAYFNDQHHGEPHRLLVKTSGQDEMNALIDADPDAWFRPAYIWRADGLALSSTAPIRLGSGGRVAGAKLAVGGCASSQADGCGGSVLNGVEGRS
jgi:hypothetical protein